MKTSKFTFIGHEFKLEFDGSLEDALKLAIDANIRAIYLMKVDGKQYYFDDEDASRVAYEDLSWEEYQEKWWCDGLVRNRQPIGDVNDGQLWLTRGDEKIVVNDCYVDVTTIDLPFEKIF